MSAADIRLAVALLGLGLVLAGLAWLAYRAAVALGWPRIRELIKDPPFVLILAGGLISLVGFLYGAIALLVRLP